MKAATDRWALFVFKCFIYYLFIWSNGFISKTDIIQSCTANAMNTNDP